MAPQMSKFFSIGHFKPFLVHARSKYPECTEFELVSSPKIHGSHLDLVMTYNHKIQEDSDKGKAGATEDASKRIFHVQSRNNVIDMNSNMHGAVTFVADRQVTINQFFDAIVIAATTVTEFSAAAPQKIIIACEFAGSNIQKNVAFTQVDKCLIIFGVQVNDKWMPHQQWSTLNLQSEKERIYNVMDTRIPRYDLTLKMNDTGVAQNHLAALVDKVEAQCPFAFHILEVDGIGEGLVFHAKGYESDPAMYFKVKGPKHTETKVKTLKPISQEYLAQLQIIDVFVNNIVTHQRLEQGLDYMYEQQLAMNDNKNMGAYIRWVIDDVNKECSDDMKDYHMDVKKVQQKVAERAKTFFLDIAKHPFSRSSPDPSWFKSNTC